MKAAHGLRIHIRGFTNASRFQVASTLNGYTCFIAGQESWPTREIGYSF